MHLQNPTLIKGGNRKKQRQRKKLKIKFFFKLQAKLLFITLLISSRHAEKLADQAEKEDGLFLSEKSQHVLEIQMKRCEKRQMTFMIRWRK